MENIIGANNRLSAQWKLLSTEGEPFNLTGYELSLLVSSGRGRTDIAEMTVSGADSNILSFVLEVKDLHFLGNHNLSLTLLKNGRRFATVTYRDAFRVSARFEDNCECTQKITLTSCVNVIHSIVPEGEGVRAIMVGEDGPYEPDEDKIVHLPSYPTKESLGVNDIEEDIAGLNERVEEIERHGAGSSVDWNQIQQGGTKIAEIKIGEGTPIKVFVPQQVKSIVLQKEYYQAHTSSSTVPTGTWTESAVPSDFGPDKPYLWKKIFTLYSDDTETWTEPTCISSFGQTGAPGDESDVVYALSDVSLPISVTILDNTPQQSDSYLPTFVFAYGDSTTVQTLTTRAIPGISDTHRFRYKSIRKKVNGVWGAFSAPALDANFAVASLSAQEIATIKQDVQTAIEGDLATALNRIQTLEGEFDDIDTDLGGIHTSINSQTGRLEALEARTVWTSADIASIADVQINAAESTIKAWAAAETTDMFTDAGITINGIAATVEQFADFYDETGTLSSVHQRLSAAEAVIETAATTADITGAINDARTEWQAGDNAAILSSVTKARYLMSDNGTLLDTNGNPLYYKGSGSSAADRIYFDGTYYYTDADYTQRYTGSRSLATYPDNLAVGITTVDAMSFIRQTAGEVDITAISDGQAAQILLKAGREGQTDIVLDADVITFRGSGVFEDSASIQSAWIDQCQITDCTIISDLKSANYVQNVSGFFIDGDTGTGEFHNASIYGMLVNGPLNGGDCVVIDNGAVSVRSSFGLAANGVEINPDEVRLWDAFNSMTIQPSTGIVMVNRGVTKYGVFSPDVASIIVGTGSDQNTLYIEL